MPNETQRDLWVAEWALEFRRFWNISQEAAESRALELWPFDWRKSPQESARDEILELV